MNYDHLAKLFDAARAAGATTADALRVVDLARDKICDDRDAIRAHRCAGALIKEIAAVFGISYGYARRICTGVRRGKGEPKPVPPIVAQVVEATANYFDLTTDQLVVRRGRPARHVRTALRAASLVMREARLSYPAIARGLGRKDHTTAMYTISAAKTDDDAMAAAAAIAAVVGVSMDGAPALERMAA